VVASKIAKKKLLGLQQFGRGKVGFQKRSKFSDFSGARKRGAKSKMRGIFGEPGLGLAKPSADPSSKNQSAEEEPGVENRLVLCSAKDKFVLTQDICVMCGAIGTDLEGCLIACAQCGQTYHNYCVNIKITKIILQKGWRCLDCTVCEGCGQRNDESRLILCDECDISYHIYCMNPPLDYVPMGNWKCKWCTICQKCGSNEPGYNCTWKNNYSECGPCASQSACPSCSESYSDGELIIQCTQCERWLHGLCDSIRSEGDAERCAEDGYTCILCRPHDIPPPHLQPKKKQLPAIMPKTIATTTSATSLMPLSTFSTINANNNSGSVTASTSKSKDDGDFVMPLALDGSHYIDGVILSEHGLGHIKSLQMEFVKKTKQRKAKIEPVVLPKVGDKNAGILAAIESVVAGSSLDNSLEDGKLEPLDPKEEAEIYKDGMLWSSADSSPPEGFTLGTNDQGAVVLRKKRQRNLQKVGIGGFHVRNRNVRGSNKDGSVIVDDDLDGNFQANEMNDSSSQPDNKTQKRKPQRRKPKSKLIETYPSYLQEAFFGKPLLETSGAPELEMSSSEDDEAASNVSDIKLSMDELKLIEDMRAKQQQLQEQKLLEEQKHLQQLNNQKTQQASAMKTVVGAATIKMETNQYDDDDMNSDTEGLKDVLGLPGDLLDSDLVNTIMNEEDIGKTGRNLVDELTGVSSNADGSTENNPGDELADILSPHFNLDMVNMDCKDVEEIFKGVLTDESQESQESMFANSLTPYSTPSSTPRPMPSHSADPSKQMMMSPPYKSPMTPMMMNQQQQQQMSQNLISNNVTSNLDLSQSSLMQKQQQSVPSPQHQQMSPSASAIKMAKQLQQPMFAGHRK
jgi:[histone H3]-lysine4 N-trimethyltransferase MLL3